MSKIKCTFDYVSKSWLIQEVSLMPEYTNIEFYVRSDQQMTFFNNLEFGYKLLSSNEIISQKKWPTLPGMSIQCADATVLEYNCVELTPERSYTLEIYLTDSGETFTESRIFITGRTPQPHSSWVWNPTLMTWESPVGGCPGPGYWWDESQKNWIHLVNPLPPDVTPV
jgi:hypothetical protein